jgi:antirestriction protein
MSKHTQNFPPSSDQFDVQDVIARFEELEDIDPLDDEEAVELALIKEFLEEIKGCGGDEQWRGDWYPVGFIADTYFEEYAQELADDIGAIPKDASWPATCIDWEQAARELQQDYSSVEIDGTTYWYR